MAQLAVQFAVSYLLTRLSQPNGPRLKNLKGFTADYNAPIPIILGPENRAVDNTVIWATQIKETKHKHKPATDYLFGLVGALLPSVKTYTYSVDFAVLICGNEILRINRIWANKKLIYGDGASTGDVATIRVYTGTYTQLPDPTIEADKGVGNVPAYLGISYVVFDEFQLANYNNAVPYQIEFEVVEAETASLRRVVVTLSEAAGIDTNTISTSGLVGSVRGMIISDNVTVADAYRPLTDAFAFDVADVAGSLRFVPRGRHPMSTITNELMGGHDVDDERPEPIRFTRGPEIGLPQEVVVNYADPARDYQPNSQVSRRAGGTSQANIDIDTGMVMTSDEAQAVADRVMWEAWSMRSSAAATADDRREDVSATDVHAFLTPTGYDTYRVLRRARGVNGVIEWQLVADRPLLYDSELPGVPAPVALVSVITPEPINAPVFIEPPSFLTGGAAMLLIGISGGNGTLASGGSTYLVDPNWPGVSVYVAKADVEAQYRTAGRIDTAAYMGVLTKPLALTSGATPDVVNILGVDLNMSGGILESVTPTEAEGGAINLCWVEIPGGGGEFMTFETQLSIQPYVYDCSGLYRGLHGSEEAAHDEGADFVMIDDAVYRFSLPADLVGVPLFFKFVQPNQTLADVVAYPYTPTGGGFFVRPPSNVTVTPATRVQTDGTNIIELTIAWEASTDPLLDHYAVSLSSDAGASFFAVGNAGAGTTSITYQPALPGVNYIAQVVAVSNQVGGQPSAPATSGSTGSGSIQAGIGPTVAITASEDLSARSIVSFHDAGGAKVRLADDTDDTKQADGFVLTAVLTGQPATVFLPGGLISGLSALTPGALYFLGAAGSVTITPPSTPGEWLQEIGKAADATHLPFAPKQGTLLQ